MNRKPFNRRFNANKQPRTTIRPVHRPSRRCSNLRTSASLDELQKALQQAVLREEYKEAADLQAAIREHPDSLSLEQRKLLQKQLQQAIEAEDFKTAAVLRDELDLLPPEDSAGSTGDLTYTSVAVTRGVRVEATSAYIPQRSAPDRGTYFFVYQIKITNTGKDVVQLKNRHWKITDANDRVEEVRGPGVIGQQPVIGQGNSFSYTSACPLKTMQGVMEGRFECLFLTSEGDWGDVVDVRVGKFLLTTQVIGKMDA